MATPIDSLRDAFSQIDDPRKPRGVRHPYSSLLSLVFLGLLCRQTELAALQRWAEDHWETLRGALGFTGSDMHTVGNGWDGVNVENGATLNTIGGTASGARNVISGNTANGVAINDATDNLV